MGPQMMTPYVTGINQGGRHVASHGTRSAFGITQLSIRSPLKIKLPAPAVVDVAHISSQYL